jgi:hypothetical protein
VKGSYNHLVMKEIEKRTVDKGYMSKKTDREKLGVRKTMKGVRF